MFARIHPEIIISDEGTNNTRKNFTLDFHCGGTEVLARKDKVGVIVLAMGTEDVWAVQKKISSDRRPGFAMQYPTRWSSQS